MNTVAQAALQWTLRGTVSQNRLTRRDSAESMSQKQYLKMLEREIQKINQQIDLKILRGESYSKEARDHRLLLKKVRYNTRKSFFKNLTEKFFPSLQRFA